MTYYTAKYLHNTNNLLKTKKFALPRHFDDPNWKAGKLGQMLQVRSVALRAWVGIGARVQAGCQFKTSTCS